MSGIKNSYLDGGGGGSVVGNGATTPPAGRGHITAYTSFKDSQQITTVGSPTFTSLDIPAGVTVFGRWTSITGNSANQGVAYFG